MIKSFIAKHFHLAYRLIGVFIFAAILTQLDITKIIESGRAADKYWLALSLVLLIIIFFIKTIRWSVLLQQQNISIPFVYLIQINSIGQFLGAVTPGRLGELTKMFYIKKKSNNFSYSGCAISIIADRAIDLLTVFIVALIGALFIYKEHLAVLISCTAIILFVFSILYYYRFNIIEFSVINIKKITAKFVKNKNTINTENIIDRVRKLFNRKLLNVFIYNTISLIIFSFLLFSISLSCNITINFFYLLYVVSLAMCLSVLPVTIAGVGIRDVVLIYYFFKVYILKEVAVLYSIMYLFVCIVFLTIIGFLLYLFWPSLKN